MAELPENSGVPQTGEVIAGKYRVEQVIGLGGMGAVVAARHATLGQRVAIKVLLPAAAKVPQAVARFLREARAAASIDSEHVCKVLDVGETTDGRPFMVMEFLAGSDLGAILETQGQLPIQDATLYLLHACEAIAQAHALGIIHRDLKPSNLFLTHKADGTPCVKVLDFGISKMTRETDTAVTATSFAFGTPLYMSPEQIRSLKSVDARTDIWSLGVILHQLLTRQQPFDGTTLTALCAAIATDTPMPLRQHRPDAPAALEAVVNRCLEKVVAKRYATVAELARDLAPFAPPSAAWLVERIQQIASGAPIAPPLPAPSGPASIDARPDTRSAWGHTRGGGSTPHRVLLVVAGASMLVALLGLAFLAWPRGQSAAAPGAPSSSVEAPRPTASASAAPPPPTAVASKDPSPPPSAKRASPPRRGDAVDPLKDRR